MKEVTLTFLLLHHEKDNRDNPTDHNNSSDDTANDDAKVIGYKVTAYRTKRSLLIASATALNAHMTLIILQ